MGRRRPIRPMLLPWTGLLATGDRVRVAVARRLRGVARRELTRREGGGRRRNSLLQFFHCEVDVPWLDCHLCHLLSVQCSGFLSDAPNWPDRKSRTEAWSRGKCIGGEAGDPPRTRC